MRLFRLLFFCLFLNNLFAQINPQIPDWVKVVDIKSVGSVNKKEIRNGYYYVLFDEQFNTIKKQSYYHYAVSVLTEEVLVEVSQIEFSYDPTYQKTNLHFVNVHRGNEIIDKIKDIELKVLNEEGGRSSGMLRGRKTLFANLSDIRKGDIIEYGYSFSGSNPIMKDFFNHQITLSYSEPVGKLHFRFLFPLNTEPYILYKNTSIPPSIQKTDVNEYIWELNNPPLTYEETSIPNWYSPYPTVSISNLKNWSQVRSHCKTFFNLPKYNNSGIKSIVDSIVKTKNEVDLQISSIIEFVQNHIRYSGNENGIYSHIPRTPDFVLRNRYGDCKEKSVLLNEMLKLVGIKAYPVLINTSLCEKTEEEAPSINAFNHCISVFTFEGKLWFIDPTISNQRGHFKKKIIPSYGIGMILNEEDNDFTKIPIDQNSKSEILEAFVIDDFGNATLRVESAYTGTCADDIRYYYLTNSLAGIQDDYRKFYNKYSDDLEVIDTVRFIDDEKENIVKVMEYYSVKNLWAITDSSKSKVISKDFSPYALSTKLNFAEVAKRKDPLKIFFPHNHTHTITVTKKGGWSVNNDLKEKDTKYFTYTYSTKVYGNTLHLVYNYRSKTGTIDAKDYKDYKEQMDFINYNMVFGAQQNPIIEGTIGFNWGLLMAIIAGLILSSILCWYIYKHPSKNNYESRYNSIGGWLVLVGIGVSITPLTLLFTMYNNCAGEMNVNYLVYFFDEKSTYFSPLKGYYALFLNFFNAMIFAASILLIILFYQKKNSFRIFYAGFKIFNTLFIIINVIVLHKFYSDSLDLSERAQLSKETTGMVRLIVQACIWVPYILISERSKHTFTNGNFTEEALPKDEPPKLN